MKKWCAKLHTIFFILQWHANLFERRIERMQRKSLTLPKLQIIINN